MIQLTQSAVLASPGNLQRLSEEFAETGCARLPGFIAPAILKYFLAWLDSAHFEIKNETHEGKIFGTTLFVKRGEKALCLLNFVLNRPALFRAVENVTRCENLAGFNGRIHRTGGGTNHQINWHDDVGHSRKAGMTINLSSADYTGGVFQLRDPARTIRSEIGHSAPGDAFLFRIDSGWQHRLTPVESGSRTVGVGWFLTNSSVKTSP